MNPKFSQCVRIRALLTRKSLTRAERASIIHHVEKCRPCSDATAEASKGRSNFVYQMDDVRDPEYLRVIEPGISPAAGIPPSSRSG